MSRQKILIGTFLIGLLVLGGFFIVKPDYWSEAFPQKYPGVTPEMAGGTARTGRAGAATSTKPAATSVPPTLMRELPRQALLITALHDFGVAMTDRAVDFSGPVRGPGLACRPAYEWSKKNVHIVVQDAAGKELRAVDVPVPIAVENYIDYGKLAAAIEPLCDAQFAPLLTAAGNARKTTAPADPARPGVSDDVEKLLTQIDPQRSFLAAAALHEAVATSGETPELLAALVRAYANLGDATRYLYSPHGSAFFARSLVYAERLVRKHPNLPLAHAARGYAYAMFGQPTDARRAFERARELAGTSAVLPAWAKLADDLSRFRTRELYNGTNGPAAPLASYFATLSVEHSGMTSLVINASRLTLQHNPGALRVVTIMNDNSGVSLQHETTSQSTTTQFALLARLAEEDAAGRVPEPIRAAAAEAKRRNFAPPALLALLAAMDAQPADARQLLPWSTYASIARDALFVSAFQRLFFTDRMLGTDATNRLKAWWPILKDHRYAPALLGFDRTGELGGTREARAAIRNVDMFEMYARNDWMNDYVRKLNATTAPATQPQPSSQRWREEYDFDDDHGIYSVAHMLWTYRDTDADSIPFLSVTKGYTAKSLVAMCPDHPSALADLIVNKWDETRNRATEIERDMGHHPQVAYALARAYRHEKRFDDAARLLEQVIAISPDRPAYEELAEMYKQQGDDDKWLAVYEKYLAGSEDFGLEHAKVNEDIAYTLMRMKKFDRALKYAQGAGESFSFWGLRVHAACLTEMGRYDEAEQIEKASQERYDTSYAWHRWCHTTGRGDLEGARKDADTKAREVEKPDGDLDSDAAVSLLLDGQRDRARTLFERAYEKGRDPYEALQLALLQVEDGKLDAATETIEQANLASDAMPSQLAKLMGGVAKPIDDTRPKIYAAAVNEMLRCLAEPAAIPARDGEVKVILDAVEAPQRTCVAYFFGRLCELRNKPDDAKWWYRTAMETQDWTSVCRPQAAAGLRRLGEPYYK